MSTVPTSGISLEVPLLAPVLLILTSVGREERHNRRRRAHPARAARANDGQIVAAEPCLRRGYEPDFLVGPRPIPDRGRSAWAQPTLLPSGGRVNMRPPAW